MQLKRFNGSDFVNKLAKNTIKSLGAILAVPAVCYMPFVITDSLKKYDDDSDYLMILGCNIIGADTPCPQLCDRMDRAAEYLNLHQNSIVVACGGCFRPKQTVSEAEIIKNYLVDKGIDESRILLEDKSTTTYENFEFALKIIEEHSNKKVNEIKIAFLTSDYHIFRSGMIAKNSGIQNVLKVSASTHGKSYKSYVREYFVGYDFIYRYIKNRIS